MFKVIADKIKRDKGYPERAFTIDILNRVLKGTFYDHLDAPFHVEKNDSNEYIPLHCRRPSVKYRLAKIVVDDTVSLLFGDGHFPQLECDNEDLRTKLQLLVPECNFNEVLIRAATMGSVGSVAILLRVLNNKLYLTPICTQYLTPVYNPLAPDQLLKVTEKYKVGGNDLIAAGYLGIEENEIYWLTREWDAQNETRYLPLPVSKRDAIPQIDTERTTNHALGFVPLVWIRNLPNGDEIDGDCTFAAAIEANIEIDYQLSQVGRGLRYASDPTLLIKEPAFGENSDLIMGAGNGLLVSKDGDAKYLEISGEASKAVIDYVKFLREVALENVHGNRSNPDKIAAAQSGRAIELMHQSLVWLTDKLRITYGNGLVSLLKMVIQASQKYKITLDKETLYQLDQTATISLRWPAWFAPTTADKQSTANTLKTLKDAALISQETGVKVIAADYDIQDTANEIKQIEQDQEKFRKLNQPTVTETAQI